LWLAQHRRGLRVLALFWEAMMHEDWFEWPALVRTPLECR